MTFVVSLYMKFDIKINQILFLHHKVIYPKIPLTLYFRIQQYQLGCLKQTAFEKCRVGEITIYCLICRFYFSLIAQDSFRLYQMMCIDRLYVYTRVCDFILDLKIILSLNWPTYFI